MVRFRENEEARLEDVRRKLDYNQQFGELRYSWNDDDILFLVALVDGLRLEIGDKPECTCDGGDQGDGLCAIPHEPTCPVHAWERRPLP